MAFPTSLSSFPSAGTLAIQDLDTTPHSTLHGNLGTAIANLEATVGITGSAVTTSHDYRIAALETGTRLQVYASTLGVTTSNSAAVNTFNFNVNAAAISTPVDFVFEDGTYQTNGFQVTNSNQRIIGQGSISGTSNSGGTKFVMNGTGDCVLFRGDDASYDVRLFGVGLERVMLYNNGTSTNRGLVIKHVTCSYFRDVHVQNFRGDGGGLFAYNFADSNFYDCSFSWCGSASNSTNAVIKFTGTTEGGDSAIWAVDSIRFFGCRWEVNQDRIVTFEDGNSFYVNKIAFIGCKFESNEVSGANDSNQSQFHIQNCSFIHFVGCDWTYNTRTTAHVLPCCIRVYNTSTVFITDSVWSFQSSQIFTNFIVANSSAGLVSLANFWVNGGTGFPTLVLKASNTPRLSQKGVGFTPNTGGSKVATDWYTSAEWATGGVIA